MIATAATSVRLSVSESAELDRRSAWVRTRESAGAKWPDAGSIETSRAFGESLRRSLPPRAGLRGPPSQAAAAVGAEPSDVLGRRSPVSAAATVYNKRPMEQDSASREGRKP